MLIHEGWPRALALALVLSSAACRGVLGVEPAEFDEDSDALECALPAQRPEERCVATNSCEQCLEASCEAGELKTCIDDANCRGALISHRVCIRDDCRDDSGACGECLGQVAEADCLADCSDECQGGELVSLCELFCACLAANCPDDEPEDCLASCRDTEDWELQCVLTHCELAESPQSDHCLHATHAIPRCESSPPEVDLDCDASRGLRGYGCDRNSDCCSDFCQGGSCQ